MDFTSDDLLHMKKEELTAAIKDSAPQQTGDTFCPELLAPLDNPVRKLVTLHADTFKHQHSRLVKRLAYLIPAFIFIPAALAILFKLGPELPSFLFVGCIILTIIYFWFTGRVNGWKKRTFTRHQETAERQAEQLVDIRASQWARNRYQLPAGDVEWSEYGSEFRLGSADNAMVLVWEEVSDGQYRLKDLSTGTEPQLKTN
jgi:hypothetical protein